MAAVSFSAPELALDDMEAKSLSEGILAVQSHYNFAASAEMMAWVNLAFILMGIYGPRVVLIKMRKVEEKAKKKDKDKSNVTGNIVDIYGSQNHAPTNWR